MLTVLTGYLDVLLYTLRVGKLSYTSHECTDRATHPCLHMHQCDCAIQKSHYCKAVWFSRV